MSRLPALKDLKDYQIDCRRSWGRSRSRRASTKRQVADVSESGGRRGLYADADILLRLTPHDVVIWKLVNPIVAPSFRQQTCPRACATSLLVATLN